MKRIVIALLIAATATGAFAQLSPLIPTSTSQVWQFRAQATVPAIAPAGYGKMYLDSTCGCMKWSYNGSAFSSMPMAPNQFVASFNSRTGTVVPTSGDYAVAQVTGAAPLASPALTGVPAAPTAAPGTNTTQVATTAFVLANGAVPSVFGRTGAVVATSGDYTFAQIGSKPTTIAGYGITDSLVNAFNGRSGTVAPATNDYAFSQISGTVANAQLPGVGTAGTYGDGTHTLTVTTDAQGRVSGVTTNAFVLPANTTATASQFFTAYNSATGAYTKAQLAFTDISGTATAAQSSGFSVALANDGATGTAVNLLVKLTGAPSTAIKAATTDTAGIVGVCTSGCSTSGSATIARAGIVSCVFDGATTANDYVQISTSTAGNCHDTGSTTPPTTGGQVLGRVLSTNGAGGTYSMTFHPGTQAVPTAAADLLNGTSGSGAIILQSSPTITTPTIASFTNATHTHQNAAAGGTLSAAAIASGTLGLARGGTNADLSATGAASNVLKQVSSGAAVTVGQLAAADLSNGTTGSGSVALATSPAFTTPSLDVATATSINKVAITAPASSATITIANGKTLTYNNSMTMAGTDSTTMTFPSTSATIARTDAAQTFTGDQTFAGHALFSADNTKDIGAAGATRPRTGYFATSLFTTSLQAFSGSNLAFGLNGTSYWIVWSGSPTGALIPNGNNAYELGNSASGACANCVKSLNVATSIQGFTTKTLTETSATSYVTLTVPNSLSCAGIVHYTVFAKDSTNTQALSGVVYFSVVANSSGTVTKATLSDTHTLNPVSSGTLTNTTTDSTAANAYTLLSNATSSLTQTTLQIQYTVVQTGSSCVVTGL